MSDKRLRAAAGPACCAGPQVPRPLQGAASPLYSGVRNPTRSLEPALRATKVSPQHVVPVKEDVPDEPPDKALRRARTKS